MTLVTVSMSTASVVEQAAVVNSIETISAIPEKIFTVLFILFLSYTP
jgi:hypothetical protein